MGKRQKKELVVWAVFLRGSLLSFGVYLTGVLLLSLLAVKGVVPESAVFPIVAAVCALGTLAGGVMAARGTSWGTVPAALLNTVIFAAVLLAVGMACWPDGISWAGRGGILLICALAGGIVAGLAGGRRARRRKRK